MDIHVFAIDSPYNKAFIEFINNNFDSGDTQFVILERKEAINFSLPERNNIHYIENPVNNFHTIYDLFNSSKRIFAHSLFGPALNIFANYPGPRKFIVIFWGSDFAPFMYKSPYERMDDRTRQFFQNGKVYIETFKQKSSEWDMWRRMNLVLSKTTHTLSNNNYTQQMMNIIFNKQIKWLPFQYYNPINMDWLKSNDLQDNSVYHFKKKWNKVIMINHSANPANNHISLIDRLAELKNEDFGVVAPLSYGGNQSAELIKKYAENKLGDKFAAITDFLSPNQYGAVLRQIDIFFMNTFYSGGSSNIAAMLNLGRKVYINSRNLSTIGTYTNNNIKVFHIDSTNPESLNSQDIFSVLDDESRLLIIQNTEKMINENRLTELYRNILTATESER